MKPCSTRYVRGWWLLAIGLSVALPQGRACTALAAPSAEQLGDRATGEAPPPPNPDGLVIYRRGNLPIILLAPHGGTVAPAGMPPRRNAPGRDVGTAELAEALAAELAWEDPRHGRRSPHVVINRLHRRFVDANRSPGSKAFRGLVDAQGKPLPRDPRAERTYRDFHRFAQYAVRTVQREHGTGILLDLHGLSSARSIDMYGYRLRAPDFADARDSRIPASDEALAAAILEKSTMQAAASRRSGAAQIAGLVRGPESLASLVDRAYREMFPDLVDDEGNPRGRPATPSQRFPNPKGEGVPDREKTYFNGAYDIWRHSSIQEGIAVDAIQVELTPDARHSRAGRRRFAQATAVALRRFVSANYAFEMPREPKRAPDKAAH